MNNLPFFTIVMAFLMGITGKLSAQLQADIKNNMTTLDDQTLELKKEIAGGGEISLLTASDNRIDGLCTFDKNALQTGRAFIFDNISLGYATDAASGKVTQLSYNTAAPKELQNATFIITQNGREVFRAPVRDICNIETGNNISDEYRQLKSLRYLVDDQTIEIKLKFPENVTLDTAAKHYVYLRLNGLQTTKKAA